MCIVWIILIPLTLFILMLDGNRHTTFERIETARYRAIQKCYEQHNSPEVCNSIR